MSGATHLNILLVDHHELVRLGMKSLLERTAHMRVVAETDSEEDAVTLAKQHEPNVVVMGIHLREGNGINACERIVSQLPNTHVLIVSAAAENETLFAAIRAGASGYVTKQTSSAQLVQAVETTALGQGALDPELTEQVFAEIRRTLNDRDEHAFSELRTQEVQVLNLISHGATNQKIAETLSISEGTARNYVSNILSKLKVANRAEAAAFAIQHNLNDYMVANHHRRPIGK